MPCYFIAQIDIRDPGAYQAYLDGVDRVVESYGGLYLAVDDAPIPLEGDWGPGRVVIIGFPDYEQARRWYVSPEYQALLRHRLGAAECRAMFVRTGATG